MNADQFREAAQQSIEHVISYFKSLPNLRVTPDISPGYLAPRLPQAAPQEGEPYSDILADVQAHIEPGLTHWQSPNFMAFFPAGTSYPSILGELFSAAFNAPAFNWTCSPACTELETVVMDWVARMLGLPPCFLSTGGRTDGKGQGGGVIQGSASEAVLVAMTAARERYVRRHLPQELCEEAGESNDKLLKREDAIADMRGKLVAVGSAQSHSSTHKAANVLGIRFRTVPAGQETGYRMMAANLRKTLEELRSQGLIPFFVTATMATTATCAVDDLEGISAMSSEQEWEDVWMHVDAAYGGAVLICPEMREAAGLQHLEHFDSFDVNFHKWLLVNFDASAFFVRRREDLIAALSIAPSYLVNPENLAGIVTDYRDWQIPLGRRFRALKIWFVLRTYGIKRLQNLVREHCRLGEVFGDLCRSERARNAGIVIVTGPAYALTVVRVLNDPHSLVQKSRGNGFSITNGSNGHTNGVNGHASHANEDNEMNAFGTEAPPADTASNDLTHRVCDYMIHDGKIYPTGTVINGTYAIRFVSANELADEKHVRNAFHVLIEAIETVRASKS